MFTGGLELGDTKAAVLVAGVSANLYQKFLEAELFASKPTTSINFHVRNSTIVATYYHPNLKALTIEDVETQLTKGIEWLRGEMKRLLDMAKAAQCVVVAMQERLTGKPIDPGGAWTGVDPNAIDAASGDRIILQPTLSAAGLIGIATERIEIGEAVSISHDHLVRRASGA